MDIKQRAQRMNEIIEGFNKTLNIFVNHLDPDSLGAAFGLQLIFNLKEKNTRIIYCGDVGHPQNAIIFNKFGLKQKMIPLDDFHERFDDENQLNQFAVVDYSQIDKMNALFKINRRPIIIIDHHRIESELEQGNNELFWIEDIGSTSTLVSELIQEIGMTFDNENKYVAELLAMGIYTDTKNLMNASSRDRKIYGFLGNFFLYQDVAELINYPLPASHFENMKEALNGLTQEKSRIVTGIGFIDPQSSDDIATIADDLARLEGISMVVVWGILEGENIVRICVRTNGLGTPLNEFLKEKFGINAGAKLSQQDERGEGGARIELGLNRYWLRPKTKLDIENVVGKTIKEIIFSEE